MVLMLSYRGLVLRACRVLSDTRINVHPSGALVLHNVAARTCFTFVCFSWRGSAYTFSPDAVTADGSVGDNVVSAGLSIANRGVAPDDLSRT